DLLIDRMATAKRLKKFLLTPNLFEHTGIRSSFNNTLDPNRSPVTSLSCVIDEGLHFPPFLLFLSLIRSIFFQNFRNFPSLANASSHPFIWSYTFQGNIYTSCEPT